MNNSNYRRNFKIIRISDENLSSSSSRNKSSRDNIFYKDIYLYSWGKNKYGELGIGNLSNADTPSPIISIDHQFIKSVKSGGRNSVILTQDGGIYLCGSNIFGLLALNSEIQNNEQKQKTFKKIKYFDEQEIIIKDISIAEFHCLALDKNGKIFGWGGNLFNKLGRKFDVLQGMPNQIPIKNKIKSISCGDYHSCAISEEGILYSWGGGGESYNKGQCGHGITKDIQKPKKVEFFIKKNLKVKNVSCGGYHTIIMTESEELFSFGKGIYGQCGFGEPEDTSTPKKIYFDENQNLKYENDKKISIIDIKCGGEHSLFLSSNKKLYVCGHGYLGQLGLGNNKNINLPTIVKCLSNKTIIEIAAGWSHSLVLTSEGNVYSTGCNKYGELGIGKNLNRYKYIWIKSLSNLNIKHISAGGHHSWCLIDYNMPIRKDNNNPEPLLESNFSMANKNKRKFSESSNNSNNSSLNRKNIKSSISADTAIRRNKNNSEEDESKFNKEIKNSPKKLKKIIDDYNNNENEMSIDKLIENINKIDNYQNNNFNNDENSSDNNEEDNKNKYFINTNEKNNINNFESHDIENPKNNNHFDNIKNEKEENIDNKGDIIYKEEEDDNDNDNENNNALIYNNDEEIKNDINYICEIKIIYCDLDLSHRFIRFKSSIDYNELKSLLINNFINKDIGNISFQFQRDDEIENNNSISQEIKFIFNKMKNENLINVNELYNSYTLGIVYDFKKNKKIQKYLNQIKSNNNVLNGKGPFYGAKILNTEEIFSSKIENILSFWSIDFMKLYNNNLIYQQFDEDIGNKPIFFELRPKYLKD